MVANSFQIIGAEILAVLRLPAGKVFRVVYLIRVPTERLRADKDDWSCGIADRDIRKRCLSRINANFNVFICLRRTQGIAQQRTVSLSSNINIDEAVCLAGEINGCLGSCSIDPDFMSAAVLNAKLFAGPASAIKLHRYAQYLDVSRGSIIQIHCDGDGEILGV